MQAVSSKFSEKWTLLRGLRLLPKSSDRSDTLLLPGMEKWSFDKDNYSPELHGLLGAVGVVRRRVLANSFLNNWLTWVSWILVGFIVVVAFSRHVVSPVIWTGILIAGGAIFAAGWAWWKKPSPYLLAVELDNASGLSDRLSTALYFGMVQDPDPLTLRQRRDAAQSFAKIDPFVLFPIRMPEFANRTLMLAVIAAGLLAYRIHRNQPILALKPKGATSAIRKSLLSPLVAFKKELLALVEQDPDDVQRAAEDAEMVPGFAEAKKAPDKAPGDRDDVGPGGDTGEDSDLSTPGRPGGTQDPRQSDTASPGQGQDASQATGAPQPQTTNTDQQKQAGDKGQGGAGQPQASDAKQSATTSMLQTLKNLMKSVTGDQSPSPGESGEQPPSASSSQEAGSGSAKGTKSDNPQDAGNQKSAGSSSDSKKPGGGAGNGTTPVLHPSPKTPPAMAGNLVPDRVDLESNNFRQQGRIRTTAAPGEAQVPLLDVKPQPTAAIKGSEQENIPERYRLYVQRYFEHTESDKGSQ